MLMLQYSKRCFTVEILYVQQQLNNISTVLQETFKSISFPKWRIVDMFNSGFRSLSKFEFKCSVIQQRVTVVLE